MERLSHRTLTYRPKRFWRAALAASTCLSAVALTPLVARAQNLPSTTTPTGGSVAAGSASISQSTGQTTINQSSQNAAINWQTFNVGSAAKVQFNQPDANATTLNRVIAQSPSVIAGHIDANGNIIIINQSGIVFAKGSEVDAHGVLATTSNITDGNFMKGNLAFTGAPKPGAKIINDGHITVHDTGLVGLIAPQVANNGIITAKLGQVVLAGASAFTLDLYGDRLISLDVTKAVRAVDVGGKPVAALVTNSGLILADGGKITLTAQDADALVTQLINAGGTIRADTVGNKTGTIAITGVGGDINIAGNLLARGVAPGTKGGAVEALTDGTINVAPTARIDTSGAAGGGVVAIGTDLARATQGASDVAAPRAAHVTIAPGAQIVASATTKGNAGTVTLLSADDTDFAGTLTLDGGPLGGNGGVAEISSDNVISLGGTVVDTAINGQAGEVLLDPQTLVVGTGSSAASTVSFGGTVTVGGFDSTVTTSFVDPSLLNSLGGTIVLEAKSLLSVASAINLTASSAILSLVSHGDVTVNAGISVNGSLEIDASNSLSLLAGTLNATNILLNSGSAGTNIDMAIVTAGDLALKSTGAVTEGSAGTLIGGTLISDGTIGGAALFTQLNSLAAIGPFADAQTLALTNAGSLKIFGSLTAGDIYLAAGTLSDAGSPVSIVAGTTGAPGILALAADELDFGTGSTLAAPGGTIEIGPQTATVIDLGASGSAGTLGLPTSLTAALGSTATNLLIGTASLGTLASASATTIAIDGNANFHTAALTLSGASLVSDNAGTLTSGEVKLVTGSFAQSLSAAIDTTLLTAAGTLSGFSARGTANAIGTLGNVDVATAGTLGFTDTGLLTTGILNAGAATLAVPTLAIAGALSIAGALTLAGLTGGATQTAPVTAGTLAGQGPLAGGITLTNAANQINNLGDLSLTGTGALDVTDVATLNLPGTVTAPGGLSLTAGTLIAQSGGGAISATSADELALLLAPTLSLAGTISAPASGAEIVLEANTLALTGTLNAGQGAVAIAPYTGNTTIVVGGGLAAGTLALDAAALGSITADALLLGSVNGASASNTSLLVLSVPLTTASELGLFSTGAVLQTGTGNLSAPALVGAAGTIALGGAGNSLSAVGATPLSFAGNTLTGGLSATGSITVADATLLDIAGPVTAGTVAAISAASLTLSGDIAAPRVTLAATAGSLAIGGVVSAATALALTSAGDVTETGSLSVGSLSLGSLGGALLLTGTNSIASLGSVLLGTSSTVALDDLVPLTLAGSLTAGTFDFTGPSLAIAAPVSLSGELLLASLTSGLTQTAPLSAGTIAGSGPLGGGVSLANLGNSIATLGNLSLSGNSGLTVADATALDLPGTLIVPGRLSLSSTGGAITQPDGGVISLTGASALAAFSAPSLSIGGVVSASASGAEIIAQTDTLAVTGTLSAPAGAIAITALTPGTTISVGGVAAAGTLAIAAALLSNVTADALMLGSQDGVNADANSAILLNAPLTTGGELGLFSQGSISELSGGTVTAAALVGRAGGDFLLNASGNTLAALGATPFVFAGNTLATGIVSKSNLEIASTTSLDVVGPLEANAGSAASAVLSLNAPALTLAGSLLGLTAGAVKTSISLTATAGDILLGGSVSGSMLALASSGDVLGTGALNVGQLVAGNIGGALSLSGTNNIASLGAVSLSNASTLTVHDLSALTLTGTLDAGAATLSAPSLAVDAPVTIAGALLLTSLSNGLSETAGITAATLTVQGPAGNISLTSANSIAVLGGLTANNLNFVDSGPLTIAGPLALNGAVLSAGTLVQNAAVSVTNELILENLAGGFTQSAPLTVGTLASQGSLGGTIALTNPSNDIGTLGLLTIGGDLYVGSDHALNLARIVNVAGNVTFAGAGVTELTTGVLTAGTVSTDGVINGDLILVNDHFVSANNTIIALGNATVTGTLAIDDGGDALGPRSTLSINGTDIATNISIRAGVIEGTGTLHASDFGTRGLLDVDAFNDDYSVQLINALGTIQRDNPSPAPYTLTSVSTINDIANFVLIGGSNTTELTIASPGDLNYGTLSVELMATGAIADNSGRLIAAGLTLNATGFTQAAGALLDVGTLSGFGTAEGAILATNPGNTIASLGSLLLATAGTLSIFDGTALTIAAPIDPAFVTLSSLGSLVIDAGVNAGTAVFLSASGDIIEAGASINTPTLSSLGSINGDVQLLANGNTIGTLGNFTATSLELAQAASLTVQGLVDVTSATFDVAALDIAGTLNAVNLALESLSSGASDTGALSLGTLSSIGTLTGPVLFDHGSNSIATLGNITASTFALVDAGSLSVNGTLDVPVLSLSSPSLLLAGAVSANSLALGSNGGSITQIGGALNVGTLTSDGTITGALLLQSGANSIATLGSLEIGGSLGIADLEPLTIAAPLTAGDVSFSAPTITFVTGQISNIINTAILDGASSIELDGVLTVGSALELISPVAITEAPFATVFAKSVGSDGVQDGTVALLGTQNVIGTLAAFEAQNFQLANATGLTVAGALDVTNNVTLSDNVSLAINAPVTAGASGTVALISNMITFGTGGSATAGGLIALAPDTPGVLVDIGGASPGLSLSPSLVSALAAGTIVIGQAGSFSAQTIVNDGAASFGSNLALLATNSFIQTSAGTLDGSAVSISAPGVTLGGHLAASAALGVTSSGVISLSGTATGQSITLAAPSVVVTGEADSASALNVTATSAFAPSGTLRGTEISLAAPALAPSGLVAATDTLVLVTTGALTDTGTLSAAVLSFSAANVTEGLSGPITAGTLAGAASGGSVNLTNPANSIANLGLITIAAGDFDLANAHALNIAAPVTARNINLTNSTGGISIAAAGSLTASAGSLAISSDTLSAGVGASLSAATSILISPTTANLLIDLGGTDAAALDLGATVLSSVSAPSLTIASGGSLLAEGAITLGPVATLLLSAAGIAIDGSLVEAGSVTGGATPFTTALIELASTAPVSEGPAGAITAGTLATVGSLSTNILLDSALNSIGTLGGVTLGAADSFALANTGTFKLSAPLIAGAANLSDSTTLVLSQTGTISTTEGLTLAAPSIALRGLVNAGSLLALNGATTVSEFTGGATISAATLSGNDPGGTIGLTATSNSFADIANLTAASLIFDDATPVTITGSLNVTTATLTAAAVSLAGNANVSDLLLFPSLTGGLIQSAGTLTAGTLVSDSVNAGTISLGDAGNAIGTLGLVGADHLLLADAGLLTVTGPLTATTATLAAGTIALAGTLTDNTLLALDDTSGGITQTAGTLAIGTLASDIADVGPVSLTQPGNNIAALGAFTMASGSLALATSGTLTLAGATTLVAAVLQADSIVGAGALTGVNITLAAPGGVTIEAPLAATSALTIETAGNASETLAGAVSTATLTTGPGTIGGNLDFAGLNSIATISNVILPTGTITLNDATSLVIAGLVSAPVGSLTAAQIDLTGTLDASGSLSLADNAAGGITLGGAASVGSVLSLTDIGNFIETGTLTAATIVGSFAGGNVSFGGAVSFSSLGSLDLGNNSLSVADFADLTIAGPITAGAVSISAAGLAIPGTVSTNGDLVLSAPSIGVLGALNAGPTLALENATTVSIPGNVTAGTLTGGGTTLGSVALTGQNTIAALGDLTVTGSLTMADNSALTIAGPVSAASAAINAPALTLASNLDAGSLLLLEGLSGGVLQTGGAVVVSTLADSGPNAGTISLQGTGNNIGTIGNLSLTAGDLLLADNAPTLTIAGPLSVATADLSAPNMQVLGPVSAQALTIANGDIVGIHARIDVATELDLVNDVTVRETGGGAISAATLSAAGALGGNFNLPGNNTIGTLGTLDVPNGQLILNNDTSLTIAGPLTANTATIVATAIDLTGTLLSANGLDLTATGAGGMTLAGAIGASTLLSLASAGGIEQTGALSAATLSGSAAGPALFTGSDNVASLGAFTAPGEALTLADITSLAISGPVSVDSATISAASLSLIGSLVATGGVTLAGATGIALSGVLDAGTTLALLSNGAILGSGAITAPTLSTDGQPDGAITLTDSQNTITALSNVDAASLTLLDEAALSVAGLTVPVVSLAAPSLSLTGNVTATQLFAAAAFNGLSQSAGTLTAGLLTGDGATNGTTSLTDAGNAIGTLGAFAVAAGDGFALADNTGLTVAGPVSGEAVNLSAPNMVLNGTIVATTGLTLASTGDINQTGGLIVAPTLSSGAGGIGGNLSLVQPNSIAVLGTLSDQGNIALATVETLTFAEPVNAANVSLSAAGLDLNAPFSTGVLQIATTGPVSETGALTVATLTTGPGSIAGALVLNANNNIGDLGSFTATGGLVLNDASALSINGPVHLGGALEVNAAGVTQTAGSISATALTSDGGTISGHVVLGQSGNAIPTLGDFAAAGNITLADASPLALAGRLADGNGTISLLGASSVTQTGGAIDTGLLNAAGTAIFLPDANVIAALGNVATAGALTVNGVSATTGQLNAGSVNITAPGAFALGGTNTITGTFDLSTPGALTQTNGILTANAATLAASAINLTGTDMISGNLSITTAGDIVHNAGTLDAGTLTGTAGQLASFAATTDFGTIGSFIMADSAFDLVNTGALSLNGPLVANTVSLSASGVLTLAGSVVGGLYVTGALSPNSLTAPRTGVDSVLMGSSIQQIGTFYINNGPGAALYNTQAVLGSADQATTLFLLTVTSPTQAGGPIALSTSGLGLYAPNADVVVDGGTTGAMTGNLNVLHLEVLGGLDSEFTGTIDGFTGQSAAGKANTFPVAVSRYQFNACPIGSVDCQIINIAAVPATNPLGNFDVTQRKRRRLDKNVQLPGIATHDF